MLRCLDPSGSRRHRTENRMLIPLLGVKCENEGRNDAGAWNAQISTILAQRGTHKIAMILSNVGGLLMSFRPVWYAVAFTCNLRNSEFRNYSCFEIYNHCNMNWMSVSDLKVGVSFWAGNPFPQPSQHANSGKLLWLQTGTLQPRETGPTAPTWTTNIAPASEVQTGIHTKVWLPIDSLTCPKHLTFCLKLKTQRVGQLTSEKCSRKDFTTDWKCWMKASRTRRSGKKSRPISLLAFGFCFWRKAQFDLYASFLFQCGFGFSSEQQFIVPPPCIFGISSPETHSTSVHSWRKRLWFTKGNLR